jgi:hypothetical protein
MKDSLVLLPLVADAGVPMLFFTLPVMLMLLIPIILLEGFLCKKWLDLTTWEAMKSNAVSNLASTIIGVPVAWAVMLGLEFGAMGLAEKSHAIDNWHSPLANLIFLLLGSAWIGPPEKDGWLVPAATLVLLIPFFFASYGMEYLVIKFMVGMPEGGPPNLAYPRVRIAVRNANLISYGAMFVATAVWLLVSLPHH